MNYTSVHIGGRLTRDPELRVTQSGKSVCAFSVAVNRTVKSADGRKTDEADFFDCLCYDKTAETVARFFTKGREIFVFGRLKLDRWEDKNGAKRSAVRVIADGFQFCSPKEDSGVVGSAPAHVQQQQQSRGEVRDAVGANDCPF